MKTYHAVNTWNIWVEDRKVGNLEEPSNCSLLEKMGMHKNSRLLEVGCGPGRASKHLLDFLDDGNYFGVDYNADFIKVPYAMAEKNKLMVKRPSLEVVQDFNFT